MTTIIITITTKIIILGVIILSDRIFYSIYFLDLIQRNHNLKKASCIFEKIANPYIDSCVY